MKIKKTIKIDSVSLSTSLVQLDRSGTASLTVAKCLIRILQTLTRRPKAFQRQLCFVKYKMLLESIQCLPIGPLITAGLFRK